jgi:hypothetical protein
MICKAAFPRVPARLAWPRGRMQERDPGRLAEAKGLTRSEVKAGADGSAPGALARADLRDQVTVFVTTVGAPTFEACLAHLRQQDCDFAIEIIDHVAPISAACQRMLEECRTPFYVQVDEDMLLRPHAVRTLYERIAAAEPDVAEVVGALFDVHLKRGIEGVKIFRHAILRNYPFENRAGCDAYQVRRLVTDGFEILRPRTAELTPVSTEIMGLHGTSYTARSMYERYLTLQLKHRRGLNGQWFGGYAHRFLERFLEDPSELNFYALMAIVSAHLIEMDTRPGEKDYGTYDDLPGYDDLGAYWRACRPESEGATGSRQPPDLRERVSPRTANRSRADQTP